VSRCDGRLRLEKELVWGYACCTKTLPHPHPVIITWVAIEVTTISKKFGDPVYGD